jgi:apolipoprotein N-acyltransferase
MAFRDYQPGGRNPAHKIDFLVNITNDAWFGKSSGPWIHAMLTKFRAVENRIQISRSANTGISMAVDPLGRIIRRTKLFEVTQFQVPLYTTQRIPLYYYVSGWERILCLLAVILIITALFVRSVAVKPSK